MQAQFWLGSGGVHTSSIFGQYSKMYLSKSQNVCVSTLGQMYFSKFYNVCLILVGPWRRAHLPASNLEEHTSEPQRGSLAFKVKMWNLTKPYNDTSVRFTPTIPKEDIQENKLNLKILLNKGRLGGVNWEVNQMQKNHLSFWKSTIFELARVIPLRVDKVRLQIVTKKEEQGPS